jgi:hypothetical protein
MAAPDPPTIGYLEPTPWGGTTLRDVRLHAWIRRPDGREQARVSYVQPSGEALVDVAWICDRDELVEKPGVDYGVVPVERPVPRQRAGRVPTGHDWRRTG